MKISRSAYVILILGPCLLLAYAIGKPSKMLEKMFRCIRVTTGNLLGKALKNTPRKPS